jgi:hypothetical protein
VPVLRSGRDSAVEVGAVEVEGPAPRPPPCRRREEPTGGVGSNESGGAQIWWRRATRTEPKLRCRWSTATAGGARAKVHGATTERLADEQWLDDSWQVWRKEQERRRPRDEWEEACGDGGHPLTEIFTVATVAAFSGAWTKSDRGRGQKAVEPSGPSSRLSYRSER